MTEQRLAVLIAEHHGPLLRYLRARGAGADADDLVQEIWLKLDAIDPAKIGEMRAYLYRVAHNLMLDRLREQRRRGTRERVYQDLHYGEGAPAQAANAERELIAREHLDRIDRALAKAGARADMIFRRHRVDRVPQRVIAEELGVSLSAIEKQLQKAYRAIAAAERLYQHGAGEGDDHG